MTFRSLLIAGVCVWVAGCGSKNESDLYGKGGGTSTGGAGAGGTSAAGGSTSGGTSGGGGTSGDGGTSGGGSGGTPSGGGAPGGGGAPSGGGGMGGAPGGSGGVGGAPSGGGTPGGGGAPMGGSGGTGAVSGGGGSGGATVVTYCKGKCGSTAPVPPLNCYCDEQCTGSNDCCPDYGPQCNPSSGPGVVECGSGTCAVPANFCCVQTNTGGAPNPHCQIAGTQCSGPDVYCDGPSDCDGGQVCCSTPVGTNSLLVQCRLPGQCAASNQRIICGNNPAVCASGESCVPHPWAPQYNYCQ